jgi:hypothetical protein
MLWGMQALARWIENTHGSSPVQRG